MKTLLVDGYNLIHAHPELATIMDQDQDAAREGLLMPPKSTFFTPKLRTGLVLRPLDEA